MSQEHQINSSLALVNFPLESHNAYSHATSSLPTPGELAWLDVKDGLKKWRIWLMLAYKDICLRYRRSVLGPFWITISMAITVYSMGYLYSHLFNVELHRYFPFLVSGMLGWSLVSTLVTDNLDGFLEAQRFICQIKLPYSLYIHRTVTRSMIIFSHNVLVMIPVYLFFHEEVKVNACILLLIPGLAIIYANAILYGIFFAILGARYRDISQVIKSIVQVIFFVTPVMWGPEALKDHNHLIVDLNPFYALIELIREPLLGKTPSFNSLMVVLSTTLIGFFISSRVFIRYRSRLVYWL